MRLLGLSRRGKLIDYLKIGPPIYKIYNGLSTIVVSTVGPERRVHPFWQGVTLLVVFQRWISFTLTWRAALVRQLIHVTYEQILQLLIYYFPLAPVNLHLLVLSMGNEHSKNKGPSKVTWQECSNSTCKLFKSKDKHDRYWMKNDHFISWHITIVMYWSTSQGMNPSWYFTVRKLLCCHFFF